MSHAQSSTSDYLTERELDDEQRESMAIYSEIVVHEGRRAMSRLMDFAEMAETSDSEHIRKVVEFLAACHDSNKYKFDISDLRCVDRKFFIEMISVLQAQFVLVRPGNASSAYSFPTDDDQLRLRKIVEVCQAHRGTPTEG